MKSKLGNFVPRPAVIVPPIVVKEATQLPHGVVNTVEMKQFIQPVAEQSERTAYRRPKVIVGGRGCLKRTTIAA